MGSVGGPVEYPDALAAMESRAEAIRGGERRRAGWLLEHPPLYTAGTSADPAELFNPDGLPVYAAGRGGRYTYHGPGQRVGDVLIDLAARGTRREHIYVHSLEGWVIGALGDLGVRGLPAGGEDRHLDALPGQRRQGRRDRRQGTPLGHDARILGESAP